MEKVRLIVADDNEEFCFKVKNQAKLVPEVEFAGAAYDGIEAIELIRKTNPQVILLDDIMPMLDGVGVMKYVSKIKKEMRPKVVAISASPTDSYVAEMFKLGADYIADKNTEVGELINRCVLTVENSEKSEEVYSHDAEKLITSAVCSVGVPANVKGYGFLRTSIDMVMKNPDIVHSVTKELYPEVAKKYNTTASKIERNIRNAIEIAWNRGDRQAFEKLFGTNLDFSKQKPTNSEFIAMLADKLRLALK